jgi:hypothetical protein
MRARIICAMPLGGGQGGAGGMYSSRYLMVAIEILITFSSSLTKWIWMSRHGHDTGEGKLIMIVTSLSRA